MKQFLLSEDKSGYSKSQKYARAVNYGKEALTDLVFLAQKLPEEELEKLFTVETLEPLIQAIFEYRTPPYDRENPPKWEEYPRKLKIAKMLALRGLDECELHGMALYRTVTFEPA